MKKLVVLFLILVSAFFVLPSFAEEDAATPEGILAVVHSGTLSLREKPDASSKRVESLQNGDVAIIPVDGNGNVWRNDGFIYAWFDNDYGWLMEKLVTKNPRYLISAEKGTPVYASPTMAVEITDSLGKNEQLLILEELESGYIVNFRKTAGFVSRNANLYFGIKTGQNSMDYFGERLGILNDEEEFYMAPNPEAEQLVICQKGEPIRVYGEVGEYYKAVWNKQLVYVEKDDVDLQ